MNSNNINKLYDIYSALADEDDAGNISNFMTEILTKTELEILSKRWQIMEMLYEGKTQREIAKELKVSLCKVTRGAQILKNEKSIIATYLKKGVNHESKQI